MPRPIDPHEGLRDLEPDVDIQELVRQELGSGKPARAPLDAAADSLRSGSDDDFSDILDGDLSDDETRQAEME
ncbi:MAG TPA: hypothetical protein VMY40_08490, partial [Anaerolineae bacterium]|nr:hypothetical protein [Anaerolineae bacterium]